VQYKSWIELLPHLPENERIMVDVLRGIILSASPGHIREKMAFGVPYFYGNKGICIVWPATVPRGGIKKGVLLGFWYGKLLADKDGYLTRGTNKQIFYKIFYAPEEIDDRPILKLLKEAVKLDRGLKTGGAKRGKGG
jgi:hypothetical protein